MCRGGFNLWGEIACLAFGGYLPMILKDLLTQTHGLVVLAEKGIPLTHDSSYKIPVALTYRISSNKRRASNKHRPSNKRRTFGYSNRNKSLLSNKRPTSKYGAY